MPRKMAGIAMITIEASIVAIVIPSVVFDSAIHLYRSCPSRPENRRTPAEPTTNQLLDGNYLTAAASLPQADGIVVATGSSPSLASTGLLSGEASTWMYRKPRSAASRARYATVPR